MKKASLFIVVNAISLFIVSVLMDSVYIGSLSSLLILTLIFGLLNLTIKPLIKLFSFPITFLTLGLFTFIINAFVLKLAFTFVSGVHISGFISAILASILLSVVNTILYNVFD